MQIKTDGQNYAPKGKVKPVCKAGEFLVGIIGLDHGHIFGMSNGLSEAGATLAMVYDPSPEKVAEYCERYPEVKIASDMKEILENSEIKLIISAAIPNQRYEIGLLAMQYGKDYFTDKPPLTTMRQLDAVKEAVKHTGKKYAVYYSERRHVEAAVYAQKLIEDKVIGDVIAINGFGPHRASVNTRPDWFFDENQYGGILTDIGCHQIEQMLIYAGAKDAKIEKSRVGNLKHKDYPGFQDFGDMMLTCDNGVAAYARLDWFTPDGLGAWGDGRTFIIGTDGYIEIRKYIDVANDQEGDHVYLVTQEGEKHIHAAGQIGFPFFGQFIRDCLDRTDLAYDQEIEFKAIELAIQAQKNACIID